MDLAHEHSFHEHNVTLHSLSFSAQKLEVKESKFPGHCRTTQWKESGSLNHHMAMTKKHPTEFYFYSVPDTWFVTASEDILINPYGLAIIMDWRPASLEEEDQ